jgi:SAM-dependent methyltransferase
VRAPFAVEDVASLLLPGLVADYLDTPVISGENLQLLARREVLLAAMRDEAPLPTTDAREGYYDDRHLEYWLSGYRDAQTTIGAVPFLKESRARILDFGGASGRVIRHMRYLAESPELYLTDINPRHVELVRALFNGSVCALRNGGTPHLPFEDGFFDCITAYSVFTHIYDEDTAWLLELRRLLKPGGVLYITVHDEATWRLLPSLEVCASAYATPELRDYLAEHPILQGRCAQVYSDASDYNCNVFISQAYIHKFWACWFATCEIKSLAHDHQASVVMVR